MYILLAILGFSLLIIVHELGHFIMAKVNGIKVEEFSIGMGPEVLSRKGKETQYSLRLLPIGGYVKMLGEEGDNKDERSFASKSPLRRISVVIAGAVMNFIFALIMFGIVVGNRGYFDVTVGSIGENTAALESGLQVGDRILKVNNSKVYTTTDISLAIQFSKGDTLSFLIDRDGEKKEVELTPRLVEENGEQVYKIGYFYNRIDSPTVSQSFKQSFKETASLVNQTFKSLRMMVTGDVNFKTDVGGPITIIKISSHAAKSGLMTLGYLLAFLSVNLAVFNLLPFPALDGGWTAILLIEYITKRKIPDKIVGTLNYAGFLILMGFMLLVTLKDILFPVNL